MKIPKVIETLMNSKEYANGQYPKSEYIRSLVSDFFEETYSKNGNLVQLIVWKNSDKILKNVDTDFLKIEDLGESKNDIMLNPFDIINTILKDRKKEDEKEEDKDKKDEEKEPVVCDYCAGLDNQVFKNAKDMQRKGIKTPAHPRCNCRLVDIYVDKDLAELLLKGKLTLEELIEMSENNLMNQSLENIIKFEDSKNFAYADTKGYITVGAGKLVNSPEKFVKLNLYKIDGTAANEKEKINEYNRIINKRNELKEKEDKFGKRTNLLKQYNFVAEAYKDNKNGLIYRDEDIKKDKQEHFIDSYKDIKSIAKEKGANFENLTTNQKLGLLDMRYNLGEQGLKGYESFWGALKNNDAQEAANQSSSIDISKERNDWRYNKFLNK